MKKTLLCAFAACALLFGGFNTAFADEPCNVCDTPPCQAREGFQTIGEGVKEAATGSYETVKEGTINVYNKAANGVETGYEKTKEGTVNVYNKAANGVETGYEKTKEGVETGYEKTKEGVVGLWNTTKEKIHNATE